jgi:ClpX C4-type zinc finger
MGDHRHFEVHGRTRGNHDPVCSFCQRPRSDGNRRFVAGLAGVYICEACIELCVEAIQEMRRG